ncbi:MAG: DUF1269 domain-containing protein [Ilumatobacteraceae bacterium]
MTDEVSTPDTLVGISFDDPYRAREFLSAVTRLASRKELVLQDAVLVQKRPDGRTVVEETTDPQPLPSAFSGAMWAGLFGLLLGGPVGWLAGSVVGAGVGVAAAKVIDHGIPDEWVDWFRQSVEQDTTTVAILLRDTYLESLVEEAKRFAGARLVYANLDPGTLDRLSQALGDAAPGAEVSRAVDSERRDRQGGDRRPVSSDFVIVSNMDAVSRTDDGWATEVLAVWRDKLHIAHRPVPAVVVAGRLDG